MAIASLPLVLSIANPSDIPSIVTTQFAAFHPSDPMHVLLYPSPTPPTPNTIEQTTQRHLTSWDSSPSKTVWLKVTSPLHPNLTIAAAKYYILPHGTSWPNSLSLDFHTPSLSTPYDGLGSDNPEYIEWVLNEYHSRRRDRITDPCVLLDLCFVHPEWQGKGAGKMLVGWGVEKADEMGLQSWVEASYPGRRLYEGKGFVIMEHVEIDGGKVKEEWKPYGRIGYYFMHRDARPMKEK